jgi:hypothetical protein
MNFIIEPLYPPTKMASTTGTSAAIKLFVKLGILEIKPA